MAQEKPNPYLEATHQVPAGETRTFAELAALAGRPGAARAAGRAISGCAIDAAHPWHRIVSSDGSLASDPRRAKVQRERLVAEGSITADAKKIAPRSTKPSRVPAAARAAARRRPSAPPRESIGSRLASQDWTKEVEALRDEGIFVVRGLLQPGECEDLVSAFAEDALFERTIRMAPRGYGVGTYRYLREPIPEPARSVREALYQRLRGPAAQIRGASEFPPRLEDFWRACRKNGQERASSILLRYPEGGVNFPHRDIYGPIWFPYQATCVLSRRGAEFEGGDFVLAEEQSSPTPVERAFALDQGDLAVFASRGYSSLLEGRPRFVEVRHGMRTVTRGERFALGLVLHLAE